MFIQAAIIEISLKDLFDMELWQFVCYMEGYRRKQIYNQVDNIISAVRIGQYVGQYLPNGRKAPDATNLINKLYAEIDNKNIHEEKTEDKAEEKIKKLKENLKLFK